MVQATGGYCGLLANRCAYNPYRSNSPQEFTLATPRGLARQTLDASDEFRIKMTEQLLEKLFAMGILNTKKSLAKTETVSVSAFCR